MNLFPDLRFEREDRLVEGTTESLDRLRELIQAQKIRDAARAQLIQGREGNRARFALSKQAAFAGRVNFAADSPLGDISVELESDDLDATIDYVAESTIRPHD